MTIEPMSKGQIISAFKEKREIFVVEIHNTGYVVCRVQPIAIQGFFRKFMRMKITCLDHTFKDDMADFAVVRLQIVSWNPFIYKDVADSWLSTKFFEAKEDACMTAFIGK